MKFLTFDAFTARGSGYDPNRKVHVDPQHVVMVEEVERRADHGFWQQVAVLTLVTGEKHLVWDSNRKVKEQIEGGCTVGGGQGELVDAPAVPVSCPEKAMPDDFYKPKFEAKGPSPRPRQG
jgi:hypothetical protein